MGVTIALIQPIHGQGYNSDIPRPDVPIIYIGAFPILTARPGRRSIYNTSDLTLFDYQLFWELQNHLEGLALTSREKDEH